MSAAVGGQGPNLFMQSLKQSSSLVGAGVGAAKATESITEVARAMVLIVTSKGWKEERYCLYWTLTPLLFV